LKLLLMIRAIGASLSREVNVDALIRRFD